MSFYEEQFCHLIGLQYVYNHDQHFLGAAGFRKIQNGDITTETVAAHNKKQYHYIKDRLTYFPELPDLMQNGQLIRFYPDRTNPETKITAEYLIKREHKTYILHLFLRKETTSKQSDLYAPVSFIVKSEKDKHKAQYYDGQEYKKVIKKEITEIINQRKDVQRQSQSSAASKKIKQMERKIYRHVAVIGIDGMGNFNQAANTPHLDRIFAHAAKTNYALSMDPTISAQNWGAMLLGATPLVHGLTNGYIDQYEYENKDLPSVFTRLRRAYPEAYLASIVNWNPINHGLIEHDIGAELQTAPDDDQLQPLILEAIAKKPLFLFVQYDNVDGAGHHYGYGNEGHLKRIEHTDGLVGEIYNAYQKAGISDDTLFIVIADHGGIRVGHGGYTDEEKYVFFGIAGQGVADITMTDATTVDIAATVLYALGLDVPENDPLGFSSQVPEGVFPWYTKAYYKPVAVDKVVETLPTPAFYGEKGLASFFAPEKIALAMFFDGNLADETGKSAFTEHGGVKFYSNGVRGSCAELGSIGCAETKDLPNLGKESFTLGVWLYADRSIPEHCVVCGNRDWWWQNRSRNGFTLVFQNNDTLFSIANGKDHDNIVTPLPAELNTGWLHALFAVDKEANELRVYYDFKLAQTYKLGDDYRGADFSAPTFVVGNDSVMKNNTETHPVIFKADDLLLFNGAFTTADVETLGAYYQR